VFLSAFMHVVLIAVLIILAAREGMLGKQMKKFAVTIVPREKPPQKPPEKPLETKPLPEPSKVEAAQLVPAPPPPEAARIAPATAPAPAPQAVAAAPMPAPAPVEMPALDFEGGRQVETASSPEGVYRGYVEYTLRSRWVRPEGVADQSYVAEVEVSVDPHGRISGMRWKRGSGDAAWDDSVRKVLADTPAIGRPPPKGFPEKVMIRFDVQTVADVPIE
jgi:hypothetical protein